MEPMNIVVESVQRQDLNGPFVAKIRATSRERVGTAPRAIIELTIQLDEAQAKTGPAQLEEIARDEALRFLDVA